MVAIRATSYRDDGGDSESQSIDGGIDGGNADFERITEYVTGSDGTGDTGSGSSPRRRGRPRGSKNREAASAGVPEIEVEGKRGRPRGNKRIRTLSLAIESLFNIASMLFGPYWKLSREKCDMEAEVLDPLLELLPMPNEKLGLGFQILAAAGATAIVLNDPIRIQLAINRIHKQNPNAVITFGPDGNIYATDPTNPAQ